jgi:type II secretory ATPase GspE/PulE/Tfp pilus assembly ATPase PilB-like protein
MASSKDRLNEVSISVVGISSPAELAEKLASLSREKVATTAIIEEILGGALGLGVSDIHFEPSRDIVKIRMRLDGILRETGTLSNEEYKYVLSRIKLLGGIKLNISEMAQDGRFTIRSRENERDIEVRVSVNPSEYGATVVLRVLDPDAVVLKVEDLGLRVDDFERVSKNLKKPNGMILVTGPTGSGKTTTLYAFINSISSPEIKIITIEDPIEYHLDGIQQTQVDASAGYDFGNGLRSILRQDPDVILVGEIRDAETAGIAVQAALTGHIVFSTLHTNTAAGAIPRLLDLEVKPHAVGPSVNAILAQRLVRKLCPKCRKEVEISGEYKEKIEKFVSSLPERVNLPEVKLYEPVGCPSCIGGYKGRIGIFEVFEMDNDIEQLVHEESSEVDIEENISKKGFVNMQQDGIIKALMGVTSLDEVEKTTGPLLW